MNIKEYKEFLSDTKSSIKILTCDKNKLETEISEEEKKLSDLKEARDVINIAGVLAQDTTKSLFETLITKALKTIFGDEYSFELESRTSNNQPEMELFVVENGVRYHPEDEKGGAILDVISFMSRIVSWALTEPKTDNVLLLDEPFRCLSKQVLPFLAELIQEMSKELNLQFIYITHEHELAYASNREEDRSFLVSKIHGISKVERIK
jgi:DNA repair exonuclease SbcCD ATPase subunit